MEWKNTAVTEGRTSKDSRHVTVMVGVKVWRCGKRQVCPCTRH
jgi:hypothetical protein